MSKAEEKRQQMEDSLMAEMRTIKVATPAGIKRLATLVEEIGVKGIVYFHNKVERFGEGNVGEEDVVFDQGLIFNDGLELRRIEKRFVNMFKKSGTPVEYRRERLPGYLTGELRGGL